MFCKMYSKTSLGDGSDDNGIISFEKLKCENVQKEASLAKFKTLRWKLECREFIKVLERR